ncbi:DNA polymerase phi-domain-containing protein [Rhodocollybia butyracea]|uniref:DNA polymerase phi-domain-containing protein n=1 Tax=Rhodocollybia butyracea TaxID=206335 RepID=A0A9P5PVC4_9AGAR|nr:DNA polymerase phi-domain-containing protein [Rhodocollybia butyracea]
MTTTLPLFWHLSSSSKKDRIDASVKLISSLEHFQAHFEASSPSEEDDGSDEKPDDLEALNAQDVSYSVRRLIRGLASPRESSRLGFSVALTELLSRLDTVTSSQVFALIMDATKSQGSMTGQEERDVLFARLFGMTAIIQSGLLVRTKPLPTSQSSATSASSLAGYEQILTELLVLGEKKTWLRESAWWTIGLAVDSLRAAEVTWKAEAVNATVQHLLVENKVWSPEKIALTLKLHNSFEGLNWRTLVSPTFKNPDLLSNTNLQTVALILKDSNNDGGEGIKTAAAGGWKAQLHFVWDVMLDRLLNASDPSQNNFPEFFRIVVDESLFSSNASPERKYWGFQVFQKALPRVSENMPMLFTKNFMRTWINHLSKQDRYLHKAAKQTASEIRTFVEKNPKFGLALILQLTGVHGSQQFDKITKTKTVESMLSVLDANDIKQYIDYLLNQVNDGDVEVEVINARRRWIIDQLAALIRNGSISKTDQWVKFVLDWFVVNGFFVVKKKSEKSQYIGVQQVPKPQFSDELRQACRDKLLSCVADLTNQISTIEGDTMKVKVAGVAADGNFWVAKVLSTIEDLKQDSKHLSLIQEKDEEEEALRSKVRDVASKLKEISGDKEELASGTQLLLLASLLQQYCSEELVLWETMESCIDAAVREFSLEKTKKKGHPSAPVENGDTDVPEPVDIIVDTIIGFMEKSTTYMRTVGNQVFSLISGHVKSTTIELILTQLETRDPTAEESDDEEMDDQGDDGEEGMSQLSDSDSSSDHDDHDEGEDSNEEEVDEELRQKILEALSVNGVEAANEDDEESEEEFMDDDQMMAIDEQLAEVFRSRVNEKKASKDVDAQREATHFKNRVLDLVDVFIKKQPTSPFIVRLVLPLVDLVTRTTSDEKQLSDKAQGIIRSRIGRSKEVAVSVSNEELNAIFETLHSRARTERTPEYLTILSDCCIYLSQVMLRSQMRDDVVSAYRQSLMDFISRKNSCLNVSFFQQFLRRSRTAAWDLRNELLQLPEKAVNTYRRLQVYQLIHDLLAEPPTDAQAEVAQFLAALCQDLLGVISKACDENPSLILTAAQMREVLKLVLLAARQTRRIAPQHVATTWDSSVWSKTAEMLGASERYKATAQMCRQVVQIASVSLKEAPTKRKAHSVLEGAPSETKKSKRKKVA